MIKSPFKNVIDLSLNAKNGMTIINIITKMFVQKNIQKSFFMALGLLALAICLLVELVKETFDTKEKK